MDEFGSSFFDLATPSNGFPHCVTSSLSNANMFENSRNNYLHEQTSDLDNLIMGDIGFNTTTSSQNLLDMYSSNANQFLMDDKRTASNISGFETTSSLDSLLESTATESLNTIIKQEPIASNAQFFPKLKPNLTAGTSTIEKTPKLTPQAGITVKTLPILNSNQTIPIKFYSGLAEKNVDGNKVFIQTVPTIKTEPQIKVEHFEIGNEIPKPNLKDGTKLRVIVCNVVASFRVRCHLNLRQIALQSVDVVYKRESQKIVMRLRKPKCTAYMWSSGKIVCTGSSSADNAKQAAKRFARRLQKLGFRVRFADFKIVNVLAVSKMPYAIDINEFSKSHRGRHCSYEPELHPGVTFRHAETKATLKIFSTGSVTVTARSVPRAIEGVRNTYPLFEPFYKFSKPNDENDYDDALPSDTEDLS